MNNNLENNNIENLNVENNSINNANYSHNISANNNITNFSNTPISDNNNFNTRNNKKNIIILIIIIVALLLLAGGIGLFFINHKSQNNSTSSNSASSNNNNNNQILKTSIDIGVNKINNMTLYTSDGKIYIYNSDTNQFKQTIPKSDIKQVDHSFYLSSNGDVYLDGSDQFIKISSHKKYDDDYVKIYSNIKEMSVTQFHCGLFLDKNNDVYAYNVAADDENMNLCAFDDWYDFEKILSNVKHVIVDFNFNGYISNDNIFYGKFVGQDDYEKIIDNVKEINWPYIVTEDNVLYYLSGFDDTEEHNIAIKKVTEHFVDFKEFSSTLGKAYTYNDKLYITTAYNLSSFITQENDNNHLKYLNIEKASNIKEIIFCDGSVDYKKLVYVDNNNKLHLYYDTKEYANYDYDMDGLLKVIDFINNYNN